MGHTFGNTITTINTTINIIMSRKISFSLLCVIIVIIVIAGLKRSELMKRVIQYKKSIINNMEAKYTYVWKSEMQEYNGREERWLKIEKNWKLRIMRNVKRNEKDYVKRVSTTGSW